MTRNVYEAGVDAGIMHFEGDDIRNAQENCKHEWQPWVYMRRDGGGQLFGFPGMRCPKCHKESSCMKGSMDFVDPFFKKTFGISFHDFVKENRARLDEAFKCATHGGEWKVANSDDRHRFASW